VKSDTLAKVCYIGHGYHSTTKSTNFFVELLGQTFGSVDTYADDTYLGRTFDKIDEIEAANYELIVVFQSERVAKELADSDVSSRVLFIPMYDGCRQLPKEYWDSFSGKDNLLVFSFSSTLHLQLSQWGVRSARFQYFPECPTTVEIARKEERNAFLWCRTNVPTLQTVSTLLGDNKLDNIHFHLANDPNHSVTEQDVKAKFSQYNVTSSTWFDDASDYKKLLENTSLYFAPREFEGIGMSFLEALGYGCCVVAPNNPTMNEYIVDGVNGFLYDPENPQEIDLTEIESICFQARKMAENGRREWERDSQTRMIDLLHDFTLADSTEAQEYSLWFWKKYNNQVRSDLPIVLNSSSSYPAVTVAVVCRNSEDVIEETLKTVVAQTYDNYEIVVIDGLSTDNTLDIIGKYSKQLSVFISEADKGPYDAMSKAAFHGSGDYIVYINAGDCFLDERALETVIHNVFDDEVNCNTHPDFIVGNHIYIHDSGVSNLHHARLFEKTWNELVTGQLGDEWWGGIPCHQATFTKRSLLVDANGYSPAFDIAADHEFMFRNKSQGKKFVHCNHAVSVYFGGGLSSVETDKCGNDSWRIASTYGDANKIEAYYCRVFGPNALYMAPSHILDEARDIRRSGIFWEDWYRLKYLPKHLYEIDPIVHFILKGRIDGAMPNPCFCPEHYYKINSDVPRERFDPLVHYVRNGVSERRSTLDWSNRDLNGAFLSRIFNPFEKSLAELDSELVESSYEELLSCIQAE